MLPPSRLVLNKLALSSTGHAKAQAAPGCNSLVTFASSLGSQCWASLPTSCKDSKNHPPAKASSALWQRDAAAAYLIGAAWPSMKLPCTPELGIRPAPPPPPRGTVMVGFSKGSSIGESRARYVWTVGAVQCSARTLTQPTRVCWRVCITLPPR
ncbi:hypothetical protein K431DRAFT_57767 [Polychaeton citri CBS 116435]|uniref:Uncharacterized protein n=1 Tax=Polychaeton citri CBS 116435 TaxID=1314669 RepID=A0A9P4QC38_9PEZI|nr:hypothetical protein K431DRAFT_57767 [Polychaeton citri CBS 116435]